MKVPLRQRLMDTGQWEHILTRSKELAAEDNEKAIAREESGAAQALHPEARKLHKIKLARARRASQDIVRVEVGASALGKPAGDKNKSRSRVATATKARKFLKNCLLCGKHGCVTSKCPLRGDPEELQRIEDSLRNQTVPLNLEDKRRLRLVAHLKYVDLSQRSIAYDRKNRASRTPLSRALEDLMCATPGLLTHILIEGGLLPSLAGSACTDPKCNMQRGRCTEARTLGALIVLSNSDSKIIGMRSVYYRCVTCRTKYAITQGSLVFPPVPGAYGVRKRALCYWNYVHGAPMVLTAKQLRLSEDMDSETLFLYDLQLLFVCLFVCLLSVLNEFHNVK